MVDQLILQVHSEKAMLMLGKELALVSLRGVTIYLVGELGAGKTTFSRGFINGLGYEGAIKSPTYTIVEPYEFNHYKVYHFDLYRVRDPEELEYIGIKEYFSTDAICLIEWPQYGEGILPGADLSCQIELTGTGRKIAITAHTAHGEIILQRLQDAKQT